MPRKLFCEISPLTYKISTLKCRVIRNIQNLFVRQHFSKVKQEELIDSLDEQLDDTKQTLAEQDIVFTSILDKIDFVEQEISRITKLQEDVDSKKTRVAQDKKQASDNFGKLRIERDEIFQKLGEEKNLLKFSKPINSLPK